MTTPVSKKESIAYYKTNVGIFIRNLWGMAYNGYSAPSCFKNYRFNGVQGSDVLVGGYLHTPALKEITSVEKWVAPSLKYDGYEIKDDLPDAVKATLKPFYTVEEANRVWDINEDDYTYSEEFAAVRSLYKEKHKTVEGYWQEVEFEATLLGEYVVENYTQPEKMVVKLQNEGSFSSGKIVETDLSTIVCYADIERLLTPEFMLHTRPCSLTSDQVYKIVRAHIKENINPRCAEITSDYDFCFTVKRKIHHKPVTTRTEIKKANGRSYATPKFNTRTETYRSEEIFEMTSVAHKYRGYTVIQGWAADNLEDMKTQVKVYLDALMYEINKESEVCSCCNGVGAVVKKIGTNAR